MKADEGKNSATIFKITQAQTSIRQEIQAFTHRNINRISRPTCTHTHIQTGMPERGLPYGTGHPETAKNNTLRASEPFQCYPMILLLWPGKVLSFCSVIEKKSKIKLRLCGKSVHWSSNDFQLCIITNLWPIETDLEKHPLRRTPIKCSLLQKKVCIEQQKKVLSKKEKREV